jgi:hypothetical protein
VPGRSFADVLDDVLGVSEPPEPRQTQRPLTTAPPHPFLFFRLPRPVETVETAQPVTAQLDSVPAAGRGTRLLTPAERSALDLLVGLGARLTADFLVDELRREYRRLAHRVHPDRHPAASLDERIRLSHTFAAATDAYRLLAAIAIAH